MGDNDSDASLDISEIAMENSQSSLPHGHATSTPAATPAMTEKSIAESFDNILVKCLGEQRAEIIHEMSDKFSGEIASMRAEIHDLHVENNELKKRVDRLESAIVSTQDAKIHAVNNDQYARRSNMVVFGVRVKDKEDPGNVVLKTIKDHLKLQLQRSDIEICHALGNENSRSPRPRPLIVKFRHRDTKWDVMKARKPLKKTGIVFTEDLCQELRSLLDELKGYRYVESAWAWNGKVMAKDKYGKIHTIKYGSDWKSLFDNPQGGHAETDAGVEVPPQGPQQAPA